VTCRGKHGSWRGFLGTVRATFSSTYKDDEALAMLKEVAHPVHAYNSLVQIGSPTLSSKAGD
jgi:hypothetical protein